MSWRAIAAEARRSGTSRQRILQRALDSVNWAAAQAGGFVGQAGASAAIKKAITAAKVRHFQLRMAVPFYIAEGLASSFGSIASKAYWGKKSKKSDPFKQSGIVNETKQKSKMPVRRTTYGMKRTRDKSRMSSYTRRPAKKKKRTYKKGVFRKPRKVKKKPLKNMVRRKFDDNGVISKQRCVWLGVHHHVSYARLYDIIGEAVLKALMEKAKIYIRHYDEGVSDTIGSVNLYFKRVNTANGTDELEGSGAANSINVTPGMTFAQLATSVSDLIQLRASGGSPGGGGYYLYNIHLDRMGSNAIMDCQLTEVDCAKLEVYCQREVTLQNITSTDDAPPAEAGQTTDLNTNPLVGKQYKFYEPVPKVYDEIKSKFPGVDFFQSYTPNDAGLASTGDHGEDSLLSHPVEAKNFFCNAKKEGGIYLAPGKFKKEKITFSFKGTLKQFVLKNPINAAGQLYNYTVEPVGGCTLFAFEQQLRHGDKVHVSLGVNVQTNMQAKLTPVMPKRILKHYKEDTVTF